MHSECPYNDVPSDGWWRSGVVEQGALINPISAVKFQIDRTTKIATAGSCFAQHIGRYLRAAEHTFLVSETASSVFSPQEAWSYNYGIFSARTGNIYTARGLLQAFRAAFGLWESEEPEWDLTEGRYVDPLRPNIQPGGYLSAREIAVDRAAHRSAVRAMVETMDLLVFTLGLTETWERTTDGTILPACPGAGSGGAFDPALHRFRNFSAGEVIDDLEQLVALLAERNPRARILLTVSPVPLIATYSGSHVLQATTYSKSVLRVSAEEMKRRHAHVDYLPAYEIITGPQARGGYFAEDLRSIREDGVSHVMRCFFDSYSRDAALFHEAERETSVGRPMPADVAVSPSRRSDVIETLCDEENLMASYRHRRGG